jgi:hypothetical protein
MAAARLDVAGRTSRSWSGIWQATIRQSVSKRERRWWPLGKPVCLHSLGCCRIASRTRWEAAKALSEIADPLAATALVNALEDDDADIRWVASEGLTALGRDGLEPLLAALLERAGSRPRTCKSDGSCSEGYGQEKGKWNLLLKDGLDQSDIDPALTFLSEHDGVVQVRLDDFGDGRTISRGVPVRQIETADGSTVMVTTAYDLLMAQYGVPRGLGEGYAGDADHPFVFNDFRPSRSRDGPKEMLADYRGYLQTDGYAVYFNEVRPTLRSTSKLAEAIDYVLNRWEAFVRYTGHGRIRIDNNIIERLLRPVAIGRNYAKFTIMLSSPRAATYSRGISGIRCSHNQSPSRNCISGLVAASRDRDNRGGATDANAFFFASRSA